MTADKQRAALYALNAVLFVGRSMAHRGRAHELAVALDIAERLPLLLLAETDNTATYRASLLELAGRDVAFAIAVDRFDNAK